MIRGMCAALVPAILILSSCHAISQSASPTFGEEATDNPRANVHLGAPIAIPLNPTATAVHLGFGISVGGGYNFNRHNALVGDFLWNDLFPTNEALAKLRTALNEPNLDASVQLTGLTGNYRFELRGQHLGTYFLGGGGLYYRHTTLSKQVVTGENIVCTPIYLYWGFQCTSGVVTGNETLASWSATAGGFNGGIGFTARVGDPPYRFYVESRYIYVPNSRIDTQLINLSFGIRY